MHLANEVLEHLFGNGEVGDDAIFQWADSLDVAGRAAEHALGLDADCGDLLGTAVLAAPDGHHRRLVQHDAAAADENQGIGGSEVYREIVGKYASQQLEHLVEPLACDRGGQQCGPRAPAGMALS